MTSFTYYDERYGDTYEVYLTFEGEFEQALRYVDRIGIDPISYSSLGEIPIGARNEIEQRIITENKKIAQKL